jgi:dienelactone hydrolase
MSCADCFTGHAHAGSPRGSETTLHGLRTYVARPPAGREPKGVVVFIPDMFGWAFANNRLLCDAYAEKGGFLVYLPDFMGGELGSVSLVD